MLGPPFGTPRSPGSICLVDTREVTVTLDFCIRVGEVLLSCGAGAADVTATMGALARHLGLRNPEIDVTFITVSMQYQESAEDVPLIATRMVKSRGFDYDRLTRVDHLVRAVLRDDVGLKDARSEIARIVSTGHVRRRWAVTLGVAVMAGAVSVQLGGHGPVALLALLSGGLIDRLQLALSRRRIPVFYQQICGAGVASVLALGASALPWDIDVSSSITANIVVLLAGIGFMGALQDALTGFYITAGARIIEALLSTAGIIGGVSGGLMFAQAFGVAIPRINPGATTLQSVGLTVVGAAVGAAAFAYASYAPGRILLPIAGVAACAIGIVQAFRGSAQAWPVAIAALFIGLVAYAVAGRARVPPLVLIVPAVVPMLPGISIYRGLTLLTEAGNGNAAAGLLAMFTAASVAVALASGVILGEYVAQPLRREARRFEDRLSGPRLVGPVRTRTRRERRRRAAALRGE